MNLFFSPIIIAIFTSLVLVSSALAQTASLTCGTPSLSPRGGEITLKAALGYYERPSALGWSIEVPTSWSLVKVDGDSVPQVVPEPGTTGTLEFAYSTVPNYMANFKVTVRYPAGTGRVKITSVVIVRIDGRLITLTPAPVDLHRP